MRVDFSGRRNVSGVLHISHKSDGTMVLRTATGKTYVQPDEYMRFSVSEER